MMIAPLTGYTPVSAHEAAADPHPQYARVEFAPPYRAAANQMSVSSKQIAVYQHFNSSVGTTHILCPIGGPYYAECVLFGSAPRTIQAYGVSRAFTFTHHTDGDVTKSGTWVTGSNAGARGGSYCYSLTANDYIEIEGEGSSVGAWMAGTTNGGYYLVSINGDFTRANLLPTVTQAMVDAGDFVSGDIGKRYIDTYQNGFLGMDQFRCFADDLPHGTHTVRLTVVGQARAASSAARAYMTGFGFSSVESELGVGSTVPAHVLPIMWPFSIEHKVGVAETIPVFRIGGLAGGDGSGFVGGSHGHETQISASLRIDGTETTPTADSLTLCDRVSFIRASSLGTSGAIGRKLVDLSWSVDRPGEMGIETHVAFADEYTLDAVYPCMITSEHWPEWGTRANVMSHAVSESQMTTLVADGSQTKLTGRSAWIGFASTNHPWALFGRCDEQSIRFRESNTTLLIDNASKQSKAYLMHTLPTGMGGAFAVSDGDILTSRNVMTIARTDGFIASLT